MPTDLRNIQTADVANRTIVPYRVGGALRVGKQDVSLNRAYQRFGRAKVMQQFANRYMNEGGTSPLFGKNSKITTGPLPPPILPVTDTFTAIEDFSGSSVNVKGLEESDWIPLIGKQVHLISDDLIYDIIGIINSTTSNNVRVLVPYISDSGPGTITEVI